MYFSNNTLSLHSTLATAPMINLALDTCERVWRDAERQMRERILVCEMRIHLVHFSFALTRASSPPACAHFTTASLTVRQQRSERRLRVELIPKRPRVDDN